MTQKIEPNILNLGKTSDIIAFISMTIGTIILGTFFITDKSEDIAIKGFLYMIIAFWINVFILIILIGTAIIYKEYRKFLLIRIGILLLNIPVALLYALIGLYFLDN